VVGPQLKSTVKSATILATGEQARIRTDSNGRVVLFNLPEKPPDEHITTIRFEFDGEPESIKVDNPAAWLAGNA